MGKRSGTSWLTIVKRAFRSPSKDGERKPEEDEKKREMKRWLFRKLGPAGQVQKQEQQNNDKVAPTVSRKLGERHPPAVAAVAAEGVRLTRVATVEEEEAAVVIQKAFRGFVARRALKAFKGVVKLQALVRGQNVRRQAKVALRCMQALVRVQDRIRDQRGRLSLEATRRSTLSDINADYWDSKYLPATRDRGPTMSGWVPRSSPFEDWDSRPRNNDQVDAMMQCRREAAMKREKAMAYAFSSKIWGSRRSHSGGGEDDLDEQSRWLERWMATKQWDSVSRTSLSDRRDSSIKTADVDSSRSRASISVTPRRSCITPSNHFYSTTPMVNPKAIQVRSASPRCLREERSFSAAATPSYGARAYNSAGVPNYMTATESAKARARCLSTPRQREYTPERENGGRTSARKRLYYSNSQDTQYERASVGYDLRSPSLKNMGSAYDGAEPWSCYTCYAGSESVSPCSSRY